MFSIILYVLLLIILSVYLYKYMKWKRHANKLTKNVPGWPTVPLLGNCLKYIGGEEVFLRRIEEKYEMTENGGRFKLWMGPQLFIFTTIPEDIRIINNTFLGKTPFYQFADMWIKNGLTVAPADVWKKSIKRVHSSFSSTAVDSYQDIFNIYAKKLMHQLSDEVGKGPFDASKKYISFVTLEAICHTMMGVANIDENILTEEYYYAFVGISKLLITRIQNILLYPDFMYKLTPDYKEFKRCIKVLHNVASVVIAKKRKEFEEKQKTGYNKDSTAFKSLLEHLIELSDTDEDLTDEHIRAECDNFMTAGQETIALSTSLIFLMIGSYPKVEGKLIQELHDIFGEDKRDVTKEDLEKMVYCEAVINETLRLYPTVPLMMRQADHNLELDGCTIPEGAACVIFSWGTCRSKNLWGEDAKEFVPNRWFKEDLPHPAAFTTFSYGKRNCLGKKYAIAFLKTIMAHCLRSLVFKSDVSKLKYHLNLTVHPVAGHEIEVNHRLF